MKVRVSANRAQEQEHYKRYHQTSDKYKEPVISIQSTSPKEKAMLEDLDNAVVVVQQNEFNSKRYKLVSDQTIIKEVVQAAKKVRLKNFYATCKETKKIDIETYGI